MKKLLVIFFALVISYALADSINIPIARLAPTKQVFLSGTAATYTTPTSPVPLYIRIRMVGGGSGGGGGGTGGGISGAGTASTWSGGSLSAGGAAATQQNTLGGTGGGASGGNIVNIQYNAILNQLVWQWR